MRPRYHDCEQSEEPEGSSPATGWTADLDMHLYRRLQHSFLPLSNLV